METSDARLAGRKDYMLVKGWFVKLLDLLSCNKGIDGDTDDPKPDADPDPDADPEPDPDADPTPDPEDTETPEKKKERTSRFNEYKRTSEETQSLLDAGVLVRDEDGKLHANPNLVKKPDEGKREGSLRFTKEEVDAGSWPLVEKINKTFDHYDGVINKSAFVILQLQSENAILRDYPEFLQKESPLKKKALDIMKNDPEFKKAYRGNPEAGYWAVKRAAESLAVKPAPKDKPKGKFIIGKGDAGGKGQQKSINISELMKTPEGRAKLDELEKAQEERLRGKK